MRFDFGRGPDELFFRPTDGTSGDGGIAPPFRDDAALSGAPPNVAESELERGGGPVPSGDGLMVDEYGMYIAEGGMPVGVDVRSDEDVPYSDEPSEGGDAGVTVADIHALWRMRADLFDVIGVLLGTAESFSLSNIELRVLDRRERSVGRRIWGVAAGTGGFDQVRRGSGRPLGRASRTLYQGYMRVFPDHTCESSFMWMMTVAIRTQK